MQWTLISVFDDLVLWPGVLVLPAVYVDTLVNQ
jgi:hypothetical protein